MKAIRSEKVPAAVGPYSQAIETDGLVFISGQLPIDPETGTISDDVRKNTRLSLGYIKAILEDNGLSMANVVKTTVLLQDMNDFAAMNEIYAEYFSEPYPARVAFEVAKLPKGANVEIEAIAAK